MENNYEEINEDNQIKKGLLNKPSNSLGGLRTLPFILANEGFERAACLGIQPNMILYLIGSYGLDMPTASNIIFLWTAATNFTPIIGAVLADAYVGRFRMIGFGSVATLLGMMLLWSTTTIPGVSPSSTPSTLFELIYLCFSLGLMSIGAGGLRSSSLAFGADQLQNIGDDENPTPGSSRALASLFNWYYFSVTTAILFALTCIVYIQDNMGWQVGFGVPVVLMLVSAFSFFSSSSFYVTIKPVASVLARPAQVIVAAWRNRGHKLPSHLRTECVYYVPKGSVYEAPTEKLRFLNKACIVEDQTQYLTQDDENAPDPWYVCTTDQVEEFKTMVKLIPLWSTAIIVCVNSTTMASLLVLQAKSMDRHIFDFEIPPASFGTFALVTLMLWLVLYDRVIIPLGSKLLNKPFSIHVITRIGIGQLICFIYLVVAAVVENARLDRITSTTPTQMSALWLAPQMCLLGLADGFTAIAQLELMYSEFPKNMSSISSNLYGICLGAAGLLASLIMSVVDCVSKEDGEDSWVSNDPNKGHYDYYYWILAALTCLNCTYFLWCSRVFRKDDKVETKVVEHN